MLVSNLAILIIITIKTLAYNNQHEKKNTIKYHIKWIFNDYPLPICLNKKIDTTTDADYKWYRHTDQLYVDEIEKYDKYFLYSSEGDATNLYILDYNYSTHDQLASYEPRIVAVRSDSENDIQPTFNLDELNKNREIFTLSYLKSQTIIVDDKKDPNKIEYTCSVIVLLPLHEYQSDLKTEYNNLLQNYIFIKMVVTSDDDADLLNVKHKPKHPHHHRRETLKLHKRNIDNKMVNFLEIDIREGPILVYKSFSGPRRDNISCYLKLTDSDDDSYPKYEKTVSKVHHKGYTTRFKAVYPTKKYPLSSAANNVIQFNNNLRILIFFTFCIYF